ncbi:DUF2283 domain-containing protein [Corynebacterium oculi]|uniref:DUF2283 domain-containing protein n=1 Tax=Corynebacterium oculi TaxID=1544416 RepID=A0A0Q0Z4M0_9CORY|nr:DUF2283 domain-containing protein [Corynebacterium oculi]KQB84393.1 hypothetical protein Cocul_01194 [Corynebacterium oculi]
MHLRYDAATDTALLSLSSAAASTTADMTVRCHVDSHGRILAVEIPHASQLLPAKNHRVKLTTGRRGMWTLTNTSGEILHEVVVRCPDTCDEQGRTFEAAWEGIPPGASREFPAPRVRGNTAESLPHAEVAYLLQPRWEHHLEKMAWEQE